MPAPIPFTVSQYYAELFWPKVHKYEGGCWEWKYSTDKNGYGQFGMNSTMVKAHHVAWILLRGEFPPNLEPDHLCVNPPCVNPDHIEWVTHKENMRRRAARQEYCKKGLHRWDEQDPVIARRADFSLKRVCRECRNQYAREYRKRKR